MVRQVSDKWSNESSILAHDYFNNCITEYYIVCMPILGQFNNMQHSSSNPLTEAFNILSINIYSNNEPNWTKYCISSSHRCRAHGRGKITDKNSVSGLDKDSVSSLTTMKSKQFIESEFYTVQIIFTARSEGISNTTIIILIQSYLCPSQLSSHLVWHGPCWEVYDSYQTMKNMMTSRRLIWLMEEATLQKMLLLWQQQLS